RQERQRFQPTMSDLPARRVGGHPKRVAAPRDFDRGELFPTPFLILDSRYPLQSSCSSHSECRASRDGVVSERDFAPAETAGEGFSFAPSGSREGRDAACDDGSIAREGEEEECPLACVTLDVPILAKTNSAPKSMPRAKLQPVDILFSNSFMAPPWGLPFRTRAFIDSEETQRGRRSPRRSDRWRNACCRTRRHR